MGNAILEKDVAGEVSKRDFADLGGVKLDLEVSAMPVRKSLRRGFTLMHMMIALGLIGLFSVVGTRLFRMSIKVMENTAGQMEETSRAKQAMGMLRKDLQGNVDVVVENARIDIGAKNIVWTVSENQLMRVAGRDVNSWTGLNWGFVLERDVNDVVVRQDGKVIARLAKMWRPT